MAGSVRLSSDKKLGRMLPLAGRQSSSSERRGSILEKRFSSLDSGLYDSIKTDPSQRDPEMKHIIRIFLKDESYRTVQFPETWHCTNIMDTLWPKLDLKGRRDEYMLYMVYRREGARFVDGREPAIVLLGSESVVVEKVYLRHRDEHANPRRYSVDKRKPKEVALPEKDGWLGTLRRRTTAPPINPYAEATGGSHTVRRSASNKPSSLQAAFSNAWSEGTRIQEEMESNRIGHPLAVTKSMGDLTILEEGDDVDEACDRRGGFYLLGHRSKSLSGTGQEGSRDSGLASRTPSLSSTGDQQFDGCRSDFQPRPRLSSDDAIDSGSERGRWSQNSSVHSTGSNIVASESWSLVQLNSPTNTQEPYKRPLPKPPVSTSDSTTRGNKIGARPAMLPRFSPPIPDRLPQQFTLGPSTAASAANKGSEHLPAPPPKPQYPGAYSSEQGSFTTSALTVNSSIGFLQMTASPPPPPPPLQSPSPTPSVTLPAPPSPRHLVSNIVECKVSSASASTGHSTLRPLATSAYSTTPSLPLPPPPSILLPAPPSPQHLAAANSRLDNFSMIGSSPPPPTPPISPGRHSIISVQDKTLPSPPSFLV